MINRWMEMKPRQILKRAVLVVACVALPVIAWAQWATSGSDIYNTNTGKIGIGTTSPQTPLHIYNNSTYGALILESGSSASYAPRIYLQDDRAGGRTWSIDSGAYAGQLNIVDNTANALRMTIDNSGNVGIGTPSPASRLEVDGSMRVMDRGDNCCADLRMFGGDGSQETHLYSYGSTLGGRFGIHKYGSGSAGGEVFSILANGKVGIGTTTPSTALEVSGDVTVSGNISAKYQDIAEWVPASHHILPGTVVILDPDTINSVMPSVAAYDTTVAGVVSATPGIVLGEAGETKVRVATTGRVKVRVDATNAPVRIGDLLVTSNREGVAMKSEPIELGGRKIHQPGTLIGKALEPLTEGEGEILVLLSLQ